MNLSLMNAQISSNQLFIENKSPGNSFAGESPEVSIFGNGGIRNSATGEQAGNSPINGSIGALFKNSRSELIIGFSVNNLKKIKIDDPALFGPNLLIPDLEGLSFTISGTKYFSENFGINADVVIASSKWELEPGLEVNSSPISIRVNASYAPFGNFSKNSKNFVSLLFTGGYSLRGIIGNLGNKGALREQYFGTSQKMFNGLELGSSLVLNSTKVFISIPILFGKKSVESLTGGQVVIGATIAGSLLKI